MNRWRFVIVGILCIMAAGSAFVAAQALRGQAPAATDEAAAEVLMNWLKVDQAQRQKLRLDDPAFPADLRRLRAQLHDRRLDLAATLEDVNATDAAIRQKAEAVMQAGNQLERRVLDYLLATRAHLTAQQQQQLFRLAAEGLRQGPGWCRTGEGGPAGGGRGLGPGGGGMGPGGGGGGGGMGPGGGGGGGFRNRLGQ
jgi:hypothetical protein